VPNYEYRCLDCRRRFDLFFSYSEYGQKPVRCPYCESENVERRIGRIRMARSDESRLAEMGDPASLDGLDEDPKSLGRMMRQMSSQLGEDMGPEFHDVVDRLEAGQSPDEIEKNLPDMGGGGGMDDL
jgi:putative FmdB family regulatory protein